METLTQPRFDAEQLNVNANAYVGGPEFPVSYTKHTDTRRTEYVGGDSAIIDAGEPGLDDKSFGSFDMDGVSVPVVAELTDSSESKYLIVDVRHLGLSDFTPTSVEGFKNTVDVAQRIGKDDESEDAVQYALVSFSDIENRSKEGGNMFSVSSISRNTAVMVGEDASITLDLDGKLAVSMSKKADTPIEIDTTEDISYKSQETPLTEAERRIWDEMMLGESAVNGANPNAFKNYGKLRDYSHLWVGPNNFGYKNDYKPKFDAVADPIAPETHKASPEGDNLKSLIRTAEDVHARIAESRAQGMSDKDIKKALLMELHPDLNPNADSELAKVVTNEFRPQPKEYRDDEGYAEGATEAMQRESGPAPEPTPNPEPAAAPSPTPDAAPVSTAVVPVTAPVVSSNPTPASAPQASDYTRAA
jgi:hypothetical protein